MLNFQHTPDNLIFIRQIGFDDYADTLDNFILDLDAAGLTAYPDLPVGATERRYSVDEAYHRIKFEYGFDDATFPWTEGDEYLDNQALILTAQYDRLNPPLTLEQKKALKKQSATNERDITKATGAPFSGQKFDVLSREKLDQIDNIERLINSCKGPVASFRIASGTPVPGTNTVDDVMVGAVDILGDVVDWQGSNENTALEVAAQINDYTSVPNYNAAWSGDRVFVWLAGVDLSTEDPVNMTAGTALTVGVSGDVTTDDIRNFTGGTAPTADWPLYDPFGPNNYAPTVKPIDPAFSFTFKTPWEAEVFTSTISKWINSVDRELDFLFTAIDAAVDDAALDAIDEEAPFLPYRA